MKKMLFGLIAIVLLGSTSFGQKLTQEDVRLKLANGMISFTNSVKPAFEKAKDYTDFKNIVCGKWSIKITNQGEALLNVAYKQLSSKTTNEEVLKSYSGKEMAAAALYVNDVISKNPKSDGSELFGGTTGDFNPYSSTTSARCRWYQIGCHLSSIFGETGGAALTNALVDFLIDIIKNL